MINKIVSEDIPKIAGLISSAVHDTGALEIARMGGHTNHSYKVELSSGKTYAVRIPGTGTEAMINRSDEKISTLLACRLKIDADLLYFAEDGSKVAQYIPGAVTMSAPQMQTTELIRCAAQVLHRLHTCGENTGVPFEVFDMAALYEQIIAKNHVSMFQDYSIVRKDVMDIKNRLSQVCPCPKVPCHNDPLCENWVMGNDRLYLIDWEYAGMNDGMWDLAAVSIEAEYSPLQDELFLKTYLDTDAVDDLVWKRFLASKIYVDFLWTLWAKTRVPYDGQPMEDWANQRYSRLKQNLAHYHNL